ncbi:PREDICTED: cuticle protein 19.8-like [Papilio xuthus]|uniref:Cuticle protein 19.8-like n=1 Tax=Papilio xuthus TaxID=66420 RepID=A0AAJ6Z162_PAPXU|nr:PREDICTED: cuticle protein 19.8-like [Papilio xuthus]
MLLFDDKNTVHFNCLLEYLVSKMNKYLTVCCLMASVAMASEYGQSLGYATYATVDKIPNPNYEFNYAVNDPSTGDNKAQWEKRDGDVVRGSYSLVEPDGNVRVVEYTADAVRGFNAVVKRSGPNVHSVSAVYGQIAPKIQEQVLYTPTYEYQAPLPAYQQIAPIAPIIEEPSYYAAPAPAPLPAPVEEPIEHGQLLTQYLETTPLLAQYQTLDYLPYPIQAQQPSWVSVSGTSYGHKGNIVRRWATGPIALDGKTLTIKTKH